jgi:phosphate transport system protein
MAREAFHAELKHLEEATVALAVQVKEMIAQAVSSLQHLDAGLAQRVIDGDQVIDDREHELEAECLKLIGLQQPMAGDLRLLGAGLRILIDLERMADHAVAIAKTTIRLQGETLIKPLIDIPRMAQIAQEMISRAVEAYVQRDPGQARSLVALDDEVDHLFSQVFRELLVLMMQDPGTINQGTQLLFVASHLERIGDHTTNLAEAVVYTVTGERPELNS